MPIAIYDISLRLMTRCLISPHWFSCVVGVFQIALEPPWCILVLLLFSEVEICSKRVLHLIVRTRPFGYWTLFLIREYYPSVISFSCLFP